MTEILALWKFMQELGQVSMIGVLVALILIKYNDFKHLKEDFQEFKKMLLEHLQWHSKQ